MEQQNLRGEKLKKAELLHYLVRVNFTWVCGYNSCAPPHDSHELQQGLGRKRKTLESLPPPPFPSSLHR
jgi:hypothetical protein